MSAARKVFSLQSSVFRKFIRALLIFFIVCNLSFIILPFPVFAATPAAPAANNWHAEEQTNFTGNTLINMFSCFFSGLPFGGTGCVQTVFGQGKPETKITYNGEGGGALGSTTSFMAQVYDNPPISGTQYMAQAFRDGFGLQPKPAYAQVTGSGAGVLQPVQKIWSFFRNIAYAGFIIIFIVVGFMIMLRQRINPQTVVTVQAALPGLVIGLILVTFSYFLAGLFVDMAFLLSQFSGILFLSQVGNPPNGAPAAITDLLNNHNIASMFSNFVITGHLLGAAGEVGNGINELIFPGTGGMVVRGIIGALAGCLNPIGIAAILATSGAAIPVCAVGGATLNAGLGGTIISGIVFLILLVGLLQAMIRLIFALIMAYVQIILTTIFGPILIMLSALPGKGGTLALWWKPLLANALIFPAVFIFFLIIATILGMGSPWFLDSAIPANSFGQALPLFGGTPVGFARAILAYGLLLAAPGIPDFVRDVLGAKTNQILAQAASKNIGTGQAGAGLFAGTIGAGGYRATGGFIGRQAQGAALANANQSSWQGRLAKNLKPFTTGNR